MRALGASDPHPRSAAIAPFPRNVGQGALEPGRRQVVLDHLGERLEHLEVVPRALDPERHHGLERRAARHRAVDLRHHDGGVRGERKARARPVPHTLGGAFGGSLAAETEAGGLVQMRILTISNMGIFSMRRFPPPGGMF